MHDDIIAMQQRQSFAQEQRLRMNPQLYQSIKLMELPIADLREKIEQELERNPALEVIADKSTVPLDEAETRRVDRYEYFETTSDPGRRGEQASEEHRRFIEGALARPETLQQHLLWQLQLEPVDDELKLIAETLIQNLNDDGFHKEEPQTLFPQPQPRLAKAMELVRGLEPAGCCTNDYRESLKVQIGMTATSVIKTEVAATEAVSSFESEQAQEKIDKILDNLELLEREKFSAIKKKTGISEDEIKSLYNTMKKLSPFPGRAFAPADIRYVIPDIKVVKDKDEFSIILNDEIFPVLGVNKFFEKIGKSAGEAEAKNFAKENIREARLFIDHLKRRNKTLIRVANAILQFQRAFFIYGPKSLAPLTLGDIAKELDIHETTVSRIANGKYMQTEWGIFEIRYFFTNSISGTGSSGSKYSKESVKEVIREIITVENRLLSDQDISALLSKKGIALARRTVAKYRKELDMGSSYTRKVRKNPGGSE
ncbi:MAG: RNA polymerase factor sigma-54 [Treponema sp.]|jgi:RNA polymerase sigma-54 factor|nr:RNA polymerase factor sigma-54 [Treponema sp.]